MALLGDGPTPAGGASVTSLVLHVVDRLTGGVPLAVASFIRNSPPAFTHAVLSPHDGGHPSSVWRGLTVTHRDLGSSPWRYLANYRRTVRELTPQLVHAHSSVPGAVVRAFPAPRTPLMYSPHCFKFDDPGNGRATRFVYRTAEALLAGRKNDFAVLTPHEAALARSLRASARIHQIPNVPSLPVREKMRRPAGRPRIGMVGRLSAQKDPSFLIRLSRIVNTDAEFVWIGDGKTSYKDDLQAAGITVTGWLDADALTAELDTLSVYVHTASYEGFPLSVLDAAARRRSIIVRRIPAFVGTGLDTFETPEEAASLITSVLEDPTAASRIEEKGRLLLDSMNDAAQEEKLQRAWSRLIAATGR